MNSLRFLIVLLSAFVAVTNAVYSITGTTNTGYSGVYTWDYPDLSLGVSSCTVSSGFTNNYVAFTLVFTASNASIWFIDGQGFNNTNSFTEYFSVYIYSGTFTPSSPCTNLYGKGKLDSLVDSGPSAVDAINFAVGTYTIVVSNEDSSTGIFGLNFYQSTTTLVTNAQSAVGFLATNDPPGSNCSSVGDTPTIPYAFYTWTAQASTKFDILVYLNNDAIPTSTNVYAALFSGSVNVTALGINPCTANFIIGARSDNVWGGVFGVQLQNNQEYTLVVGTDNGDTIFANWGVYVKGSNVISLQNSPAFVPPEIDDFGADCTPDSGEAASWVAEGGSVTGPVFILDTSDAPGFDSPDTYGFFYQGSNEGSVFTSPSSCPILGSLLSNNDLGDGDDPIGAWVTPGQTYSAVIVQYDYGNLYTALDGSFLLFVWNGQLVNNQANVIGGTPSASTTGSGLSGTSGPSGTTGLSGTTGPSGTTGATNSGSTSGAHGTATGTASTTNNSGTTNSNTTSTTTATGTTGTAGTTTGSASTTFVSIVVVAFVLVLALLF